MMKRLMHFLLLSCLKATELIEKQFVVKLSLTERVRLAMHKSMCKACRNYQKQSRFLNKVLSVNRKKEKIEVKAFMKDLKSEIEQL